MNTGNKVLRERGWWFSYGGRDGDVDIPPAWIRSFNGPAKKPVERDGVDEEGVPLGPLEYCVSHASVTEEELKAMPREHWPKMLAEKERVAKEVLRPMVTEIWHE